jgi:7,8-dihydroneopterin aldolase/epimerase/oxygenase
LYTINIRGIRIYAFHGCLPEEAIIGGDYVVNIALKGDFSKAASNDKLEDTIDYVDVYKIVKREMGIRSNLIEPVAKRIAENLKRSFPSVKNLSVEVVKKNPPIGGEVDEVSVVVEI